MCAVGVRFVSNGENIWKRTLILSYLNFCLNFRRYGFQINFWEFSMSFFNYWLQIDSINILADSNKKRGFLLSISETILRQDSPFAWHKILKVNLLAEYSFKIKNKITSEVYTFLRSKRIIIDKHKFSPRQYKKSHSLVFRKITKIEQFEAKIWLTRQMISVGSSSNGCVNATQIFVYWIWMVRW